MRKKTVQIARTFCCRYDVQMRPDSLCMRGVNEDGSEWQCWPLIYIKVRTGKHDSGCVTICFYRKLCLGMWGWIEDTWMILISLGWYCSTPVCTKSSFCVKTTPHSPNDNQRLWEGDSISINDWFCYSSPYFFSELLISLLSWPSSGEAMARLSVFQSPGSSRGCVQFTIWTVKC